MAARTSTAKATLKRPVPKTTARFALRWLPVLWGCAAAAAVFMAVLVGRSDTGVPRPGAMISSLHKAVAVSPPAKEPALPVASKSARLAASSSVDAELVTLAQSMRSLIEDRNRLEARLTALEHNLDDMTGSIAEQVQSAKAAAPAPWPDDREVGLTPAGLAAVIAPAVSPSAGLPTSAPTQAGEAVLLSPSARAVNGSTPVAGGYGADIGKARSVKALQARWSEIRAAHPRVFAGLQAVVTLRENVRADRTELRLVVGPFASAEAAQQLCTRLANLQMPCEPTMFDGTRLALR